MFENLDIGLNTKYTRQMIESCCDISLLCIHFLLSVFVCGGTSKEIDQNVYILQAKNNFKCFT